MSGEKPTQPIRSMIVGRPGERLRLLEAKLRDRGHEITAFGSVKKAWKSYQKNPFPFVVLDLDRLAKDALELCRNLRANSNGDRSVVVTLSENDQGPAIQAALAAGADDYIVAPIDLPLFDLRLQLAERRVENLAHHLQAEEALRESETRYALVTRSANDGMWDWDLIRNKMYFSPRWKSMLGSSEEEIGDDPDEWFRRVHPDDVERLRSEIGDHLKGNTPHFEHEHRMQHADGSYRWMLSRGLAVRDPRGRPARMAGSQTDTTERKRVEEQLIHDAFHDTLTGLPNRALFMDRLGQARSRSKRRADYLFAVLFLDADRFKLVNDSLGHMAGDQLLVGMARRLCDIVRPGDTVARFGGDEFAILLEDLKSAKEASVVADRILEDLRAPFDLNDREVFATASIGIAFSASGDESSEDLLRDADTAMYRAKALGKARYAVFDKAMHARVVEMLQLENELRRAIERQEFRVFYQPIVSLETGKLNGFEALARWQHPRRGLVLPEEFIPAAEENGLIVPIDRWVINEACRQIRAWQVQFRRGAPVTVSVNVSGVQFLQPDLVMQIDHVLRKHGLYGASLKIEITESVIMEHARYAAEMLRQFKNLDIKLSIDDFGTGYSSLSYLRRFELDTLKIDRSFVAKMCVDDESLEIVRTIITLAGNLGKSVVAEGVETSAQLSKLIEVGCKIAQGNYFSRPLDAEAATKLLATDPQW